MDAPTVQPLPSPQPPAPKNTINFFIGILIFILGILAGLTFDKTTLLSNLRAKYLSPAPTPTLPATPTPTPDPTANWKTYENNYWKISFKYPETLFKPCPSYTTEKEGVRFWGPQFTCPNGHDVIYKIGFVGYDPGKYIEPKKPSSTEAIVVDGKQAQKNTYIYNESDGPAASLKQSVEIVVTLSNGTVILQQLGDNIDEQKAFNQILSTFKFTNTTTSEVDEIRNFVDIFAQTYVDANWIKLKTLLTVAMAKDMTENQINLSNEKYLSGYQIVSIDKNTNPDGYTATIEFLLNGKPIESPPGRNPSILIVKENGEWKSMSWYLFQ